MSWLSKAWKKTKKSLKKIKLKNVAGKVAGGLKKLAGNIASVPVLGTALAPVTGAMTSLSSNLDKAQSAVDKVKGVALGTKTSKKLKKVKGLLKNAKSVKSGILAEVSGGIGGINTPNISSSDTLNDAVNMLSDNNSNTVKKAKKLKKQLSFWELLFGRR